VIEIKTKKVNLWSYQILTKSKLDGGASKKEQQHAIVKTTINKLEYKGGWDETEADNMAFFRNILLLNKRVDTDMEAGNHSDVELGDMESCSGTAHYADSLYPDSMSMDPESTFPCSFPAPNSLPLSIPAQISSTFLNTNRKHSHNDDGISSKVRVVEQGSNMSTKVCLYFP
jgi:hypothetical protein